MSSVNGQCPRGTTPPSVLDRLWSRRNLLRRDETLLATAVAALMLAPFLILIFLVLVLFLSAQRLCCAARSWWRGARRVDSRA